MVVVSEQFKKNFLRSTEQHSRTNLDEAVCLKGRAKRGRFFSTFFSVFPYSGNGNGDSELKLGKKMRGRSLHRMLPSYVLDSVQFSSQLSRPIFELAMRYSIRALSRFPFFEKTENGKTGGKWASCSTVLIARAASR